MRTLQLVNKEIRFFQATKIFDIIFSGNAHDVFAADVFYDQSCYIKFLIKPVKLPPGMIYKKQSRRCFRFI